MDWIHVDVELITNLLTQWLTSNAHAKFANILYLINWLTPKFKLFLCSLPV